jgi:hypothetical protein
MEREPEDDVDRQMDAGAPDGGMRRLQNIVWRFILFAFQLSKSY